MTTPNQPASFTEWAGLYVSGVLLVVFVASHMVAVHYLPDVMEEGYRFASVQARMRGVFYPVVDLALLVLALVHGLVGMHRLVADLGVCGAKGLRVVGLVLAAAGIWGLIYGIRVFRAFLS